MNDTRLVKKATYHGYLLEEFIGVPRGPLSVDFAIYMIGWEDRAAAIAQAGLVSAPRSIALKFTDDDLPADAVQAFDIGVDGKRPLVIELDSHYDIIASVSKFVEFFKEQALASRPLSIFLDITSIPKLMLQWIFMELIRSRISPEIFIGYVPGIYGAEADPIFDQGVDHYRDVPHSLGDGGASVRRGCIAALGADERLVSHYFESESGFDQYYLVASKEEIEERMADLVTRQIAILRSKYLLPEENAHRASAVSYLDALKFVSDVVEREDRIDSWEMFCSGPKPFALMGCLLALKYRKVRLKGRIPKQYSRANVTSCGIYSFLRVIDLTNPAVSRIQGLGIPMGSVGFAG